jgi:predicted transporter
VYRFVIKWVTPLFLLILLTWWTVTEAVPTLLMQNLDDPGQLSWRWGARLLIAAMLVVGLILIRKAWRRREDVARDGPLGVECPSCSALNRPGERACHACETALGVGTGGR